MLFQVQLQLLTAIVLPCPCGYVISGSVADVDSHCITLPLWLYISGSVAVVDSHCEAIPEETNRYPGACTASSQLVHSGNTL